MLTVETRKSHTETGLSWILVAKHGCVVSECGLEARVEMACAAETALGQLNCAPMSILLMSDLLNYGHMDNNGVLCQGA